MIFPLEDLAKFKGGMYGITVAASRRAYQLAKLAMYDDPEVSSIVEENDGKVVSLAARQLFTGEVQYAIENKVN
ncbi:MAG: DNA-directed RNA polymerase subunit omega [Spirochaetia bacterium]|uniref:DNA-directed RNA polymerase subunit omega n=1 Tax=Treponema sp. TaxID=166 RepID=UPI00298E541F|nr:DNA-directed RNA polymerase subunit omega [Treponema sp.]MCI7397398.1 DNA-directed RNA polymerase subunit omega [Spirochaetia bacterium]MCI7577039.1 DNA-directed RNA polymerase subunit omega [Spirochaetia bacterium]